jgi:hypothetical protein
MNSESPCLAVSQSPGLFYFGGLVAGVAVGWAAAEFNLSGWAPVGLLSLGVGGMLGLVVAKLADLAGVRCPKRLVVGTVLFALVTVFAEHTWLYRDFRRQWTDARAREPQVALFRPETPWSPAEYVRHEWSPGRLALWCVDATLIVASAVGVAHLRSGAHTKAFVVADDANTPLTPDS